MSRKKFLAGLSVLAVVAFALQAEAADREQVRTVVRPEVTWSICHPTPVVPAYVDKVLANAAAYGGVDSLEICGDCHSTISGLDGLCLFKDYPKTFAARDKAAVATAQRDLNDVVRKVHAAGKRVYLWHREIFTVAGILEDVPALLDENGEFDLLGDAYRTLLKAKLREGFEAVPDIDGFVLTLTEADWSVIHNSRPDRYPPAQVVASMVRIFKDEHARRGKKFILRSFGSIPSDYDDILAGAELSGGGFEVETKVTPFDFVPYLPDCPWLHTTPGCTLGAECDAQCQFLGSGYLPAYDVPNVRRYVAASRKGGASRYAIRIDRTGLDVFEAAHEINLYAYMRFLADPTLTVEDVEREWAAKRWPGCEREMIELLRTSAPMVRDIQTFDGNLIFHFFPVHDAFQYHKAGGAFAVLRDGTDLGELSQLWGLLHDRRAPGRAKLIADKAKAVAIAERGYARIRELAPRLPAHERDRHVTAWRRADRVSRCMLDFTRAASAYFDDMESGAADPVRLKKACAAGCARIAKIRAEGDEGLETGYLKGLDFLFRGFPDEYAAEFGVRSKLKARADVKDFVVAGGIYDEARVNRPMHACYSEIVKGVPVRHVGNRNFPNGKIGVWIDVPAGGCVEIGRADGSVTRQKAKAGRQEFVIGRAESSSPVVYVASLAGVTAAAGAFGEGYRLNEGREIAFPQALPRTLNAATGKSCDWYNICHLAIPGVATGTDPSWAAFLHTLRNVIADGRACLFADGRTLMVNKNWIRDHVHILKAFRHWEYDYRSFVDFILDHPRADGLFYELLKPMDDPHWSFTSPASVKFFPDDNLYLARLEIEADVEYLVVEGATYCSPARTLRAHILLPAGKTAKRVLVNGREQPFAAVTVDKSPYVDFDCAGTPICELEVLF